MSAEARRERSAQKESISKRLVLEELTRDLELGRIDPKQRTAHGDERRTGKEQWQQKDSIFSAFSLILTRTVNTTELEDARSGWCGSWLWKQSTE
jgi:hypothetical protein